MNIGIIGLGLIGGSMAKAIRRNTGFRVLGWDLQLPVTRKALLTEAIDEILEEDALPLCDLVIVALYPGETIRYVLRNGDRFKKGAVVLDCCGVKGVVCPPLEAEAARRGFVFMGAHPMAGSIHSGFSCSQPALFQNASMVLTPAKGTPIETVETIKKLCVSIGFTNTQISTPEEHDRIISFTSQLAHVVSSAYVKSPTATLHGGFSAGSYRDLTRVARLNEKMWTELFLANREPLTNEIDHLIRELSEYRDALAASDEEKLRRLLKEGSDRKASIDGSNEND